jgi:signal transduction histidine kinase
VQVRSTVAATTLQAVVVAAAGMVLLLALHHDLRTGIDTTNSATAQDLSTLVTADLARPAAAASGGRSAPQRESLQNAVDAAAGRRAVVQVLDAAGAVVASSDDVAGRPALLDELPPAGRTAVHELTLPFDDDPYRFSALGGQVQGQRYTVLVGESLGTGEDTLHTAVAALAVAGPLLLLAVAGATHLFIGRSLRPVAHIRSTVQGITHRDLSERVPVPPGHDEVSQLAETMNAMLSRLDRATTTQRQFVSDASHELRSPIATLRAAADITLTVPGRADAPSLAALVRDEARRLDRLVADLLLLARADERGSGGHRDGDEVDLDDLVTAEARRLSLTTPLRVAVHREPARVAGDLDELSRLLRNLTDNAARHAATSVRLALRREGTTAVLDVGNDGPPLPAADRDRIFERFVRLEESRARDLGGTGLGLAIVRAVARTHGGDVEVLDDPGERPRGQDGDTAGTPWTCFRLRLPLLAPPGGEDPG